MKRETTVVEVSSASELDLLRILVPVLKGGRDRCTFDADAIGDEKGNCTFDGGTVGDAGGNCILCIEDVDGELLTLFAIGDNFIIVGRGEV